VRSTPTFLLLTIAACQGPAIGWPDLGIQDPEPVGPAELRAYKEAHYRALGTRLEPAGPRAALLDAIAGADLLYLGDQHLDPALHVEQRLILAGLEGQGRRLRLGLEAIGIEDETLVHSYLRGDFGLEELCARIRRRWPESWLDSAEVDAAHYRALLEFARRTGTEVFALEPAPRLPLAERDASIADRIRAGLAADRLTVVVVGHTHLLGGGHLVERVGGAPVVVGARLSNSLRRAAPPPGEGYLRSETGVWFPPQVR
jgi:hypothetical protein